MGSLNVGKVFKDGVGFKLVVKEILFLVRLIGRGG